MSTPTPNFGWQLPVPNSPADANVWGTLLNGNISAQDTQLLSAFTNNIGNTAPVSPILTGGSNWINTSNPGLWIYNVFDGTTWVAIGTINTVSHSFSAFNVASVPVARIFTTSGLYTPTAGLTYAIIEGVGGGGAGYGITGAGFGCGGGAGGYFWTIATASTIGISQNITIGAGATGAAVGTGGTGGTTSVGTLYIASGGTGGGEQSIIGTGGNASGGQLNIIGGSSNAVSGSIALSSAGADSVFLGSGGNGRATPGAGADAQGYGAGGGGGFGTGAATVGESGTSGLVRIIEYF